MFGNKLESIKQMNQMRVKIKKSGKGSYGAFF